MSRSPFAPVLVLLAATLFAAGVTAQCDLAAVPGDPLPQLQGHVDALVTWDPDGAGPLPLHLVAAGRFAAGNAYEERVVLWDGTAWTPAGADFGSFGEVTVMTVWNGLLVVAVDELIRTFDGTTWTLLAGVEEGSIAAPLPGVVRAMAVWNGSLVVGGRFTRVVSSFGASVSANLVATWNGSAWSALGTGPITTGMTGASVQAAVVFNNAVWVGLGYSSNFGNTTTLQAFQTAWLGQGTVTSAYDALAVRLGTSTTNSYVFGAYHNAANVVTVHGYNPVTGSGLSINTPPASVAPTRCQQLFVRGIGLNSYEVVGALATTGSDKVWRWAAASGWSALPALSDPVGAIATTRVHYFGGRYWAGLRCTTGAPSGLRSHDAVAGQWVVPTGPGFDGSANSVCFDGAELVVGGAFTTIAGTSVNRIARGHAGAWQPLGPGFGSNQVLAVARLANGDLVAGGDFTTLGDGTPMSRIARWDGSTWAPLGSGVDGTVLALLPLPDGELIAGGVFTNAGGQPANRIARWNGSTWAPLGAGCTATVRALLRTANGDVVAGGNFLNAGGLPVHGIARWDGSAWSPFGDGFDGEVLALAEGADGLVAGGVFQQSGPFLMPYVARWNGGSWVPFGPLPIQPDLPVRALAALPGDGVVCGGAEFTAGGVGPSAAAVRRAASWQSLDVVGGSVHALATSPDGRLAAVGSFTRVGTTISNAVAQIETTCPATVSALGAGCAGNTLTVTSLPWADSVFRAEVTGLPVPSWALAVWGLSPVVPSLPLDAVFAEALPGCHLHVFPDGIDSIPAPAGTATTQLALPNTPPVVGVTFYHQAVVVVVDPQFQLLEVASTNAVQATIGFF